MGFRFGCVNSVMSCMIWVYVWLEFLLSVWFDCYCLHWLMGLVCFVLGCLLRGY